MQVCSPSQSTAVSFRHATQLGMGTGVRLLVYALHLLPHLILSACKLMVSLCLAALLLVIASLSLCLFQCWQPTFTRAISPGQFQRKSTGTDVAAVNHVSFMAVTAADMSWTCLLSRANTVH